jgi:hypothetical protein
MRRNIGRKCSEYGTKPQHAITLEHGMDVTKILAELRQERDQIQEAILTLERLALGRSKRRGRPPAWMTEAKKRTRQAPAKNKHQPTSTKSVA